jgi:hypothetical protein
MNNDTIIINPIYHEDVIHINNAIPLSLDEPFSIAIEFDLQESKVVVCLKKLKECMIITFCMAFLCFFIFVVFGGVCVFLNDG